MSSLICLVFAEGLGKSKSCPFPHRWFVPSLSHPHVYSPIMQQGRELLQYKFSSCCLRIILSLLSAHHRAVWMSGGMVLSPAWWGGGWKCARWDAVAAEPLSRGWSCHQNLLRNAFPVSREKQKAAVFCQCLTQEALPAEVGKKQ